MNKPSADIQENKFASEEISKIKMPITAIIINGGMGKRLRPLSIHKVKCMVPFMGRPLQEYQIQQLEKSGIKNIIFSSSGRKNEVRDYFGNGKKFGVSIKYFHEKSWYHTANTVKEIVLKYGSHITNPFMVIYGDSLVHASYQDMIDFHKMNAAQITVLHHSLNFASFLYEYHDVSLKKNEPRTNYGVMKIKPGGRISFFKEKPRLSEIKRPGLVANAAVYILNKEVLNDVPVHSPCDFGRDLFPKLPGAGIKFFGFDAGLQGYRIDIGTLNNYYHAHLAVLDQILDFEHYFPQKKKKVWIGAHSAVVLDNDFIRKTVIAENTTIKKNTKIQTSVIGNHVTIGEACCIRGSIIHDRVQIGDHVTIENSIIGEDVLIGENTYVPSRTVLGTFCKIGDGQWGFNKENFYGQIKRI